MRQLLSCLLYKYLSSSPLIKQILESKYNLPHYSNLLFLLRCCLNFLPVHEIILHSDTRVYMTVAVDVLLVGVHEPVRLRLECKARIYHEHERFWRVARQPVSCRYYVTLRRREREIKALVKYVF